LREVESLVLDEPEGATPGAALGAPPPLLDESEVVPLGGLPRYGEVRRELPRLLPFLPEPGYRSFASNVAGDAGFDPLGLCTDVTKFVEYREAELKHARLAMLAALAWPLAEVYEPELSQELGLPDVLSGAGGQVLPQLTGEGFEDQFVETFVAAVLFVGAFFELFGNNGKAKGSKPGDRNFDPVNLYDWRPKWADAVFPLKRPWMSEAELKHGRLAMMAVLYDIVDEVNTGNPVVEDTEYLFHRLDAKLLRWEYWSMQPEFLDDIGGAQDILS